MSVEIAALQQGMQEALGVERIEFNNRTAKFVCLCGKCANMEVSGGTAQGLYESGNLQRLKELHDRRCDRDRSNKSRNFKQPPEAVLKWFSQEAKVDIRDVYRSKVLKRNDDGSGEMMLWLFCRNSEGYRYIGAEGIPARKSVKMICRVLPEFVEDKYGYPMEQYDDKEVLPGN